LSTFIYLLVRSCVRWCVQAGPNVPSTHAPVAREAEHHGQSGALLESATPRDTAGRSSACSALCGGKQFELLDGARFGLSRRQPCPEPKGFIRSSVVWSCVTTLNFLASSTTTVECGQTNDQLALIQKCRVFARRGAAP
jgi:hypothetical protein